MPSTAAHFGRPTTSKPSNSGSTSASRICRARSARKLAKKSPSPSAAPAIVADHGRQHELVGLAPLVGRLDRRRGASRACSPSAWSDRRDRRADPLPPLVAVHGVEAPRDRRDPRPSGSASSSAAICSSGALRRHVAPVEEGVHRHRHALAGDRLGRGGDLPLVRMHAAGRGEAGQVRRAAALLQRRDELAQRRVGREAAVRDGVVDPRQVHPDHAPGADVGVPDLGVAHLPLGQAHVRPVRAQRRMRAASPRCGRSSASRPAPRRFPRASG